ncbi:hypothetical protein [Aestuariibacter sp. A3R04]|uniref:hypothetical protein n=1 Tax=Aestuariibacter sp. A3R04 TaxID=2841571 RepID=UPI001C090658|nr:hypothetical protein [Aestuariibacter sp. A3R04]MBU3021606.1 hypothetical protein [Aestuariibacter sp. A3R04]
MLLICIGIWAYLEFEGDNKFVGALVSILLAWGVAQLGALGLGDGIGEKPGSSSVNKVSVSDTESVSTEKSSPTEHSVDNSDAQLDPKMRLAIFAFAGVVVAIVIIYLMRNVDRYDDLNIRFRYKELVNMAKPIQEKVEDALLSKSFVDPDSLDSGKEGLPDEVLVSKETHGISVIDGQIIATWMNDDSDLDGVTYILNPEVENGEVEWTVTGTCRRKKAC